MLFSPNLVFLRILSYLLTVKIEILIMTSFEEQNVEKLLENLPNS